MARTSFSNIARTFKPNTASLGYALFLAINAAGVWGGVFPFLPMNFQTPEVMFWFFLTQARRTCLAGAALSEPYTCMVSLKRW